MEWIVRQLCFAVFVLLTGWVLHLGGQDADTNRMRVLCAADDSPWERSRELAVPILLYAAVEICCCGEHAAVLLPVRMLSLLYGMLLCVGLLSLIRLLHLRMRVRAALETGALLLCVSETTLLGYVLLRDNYCRGSAALRWGIIGMGAAVLLLLLSARTRYARRSAR